MHGTRGDECGAAGLRIFLSYGHDEHAPLACQLKRDLEARGHEVWFDKDRLKPSGDWEHDIERGLDWVSAEPGRGRFVLLMTPHSVRRPDGYSLNEVARAMARRLTIVPVMVVWVEPPLSICRMQWLDMQDCVPVRPRSKRYRAKVEQLVETLEQGRRPSDQEGTQERLLRVLEPVKFEGDIAPHLARFTGRRWVFRHIDNWLSSPSPSPVCWITGNPGVGKTAIAAWLCHHRPEVAAFYLCRHGHLYKSDPRRCVLSIAYQLSTQLPDYRDRLNRLNLEQIVPESDARTLFDVLIVEPLLGGSPPPRRPLVVLIDALDEASRAGGNELASFLAAEFAKAPEWLRLIITSRPEPEVVAPLQALTPYELDKQQEKNERDLRRFLERELASRVEGGQVPPDLIDAIVARSGGIFLYAEWVCHEIAAGRLRLDRIDEFPQGLAGVYFQFFRRQFPDPAKYESVTRPALEVIAAAEEPLKLEAIAAVFGWSRHQARHFRQSLGSLFTSTRGRIEPFHSSVMDWLVDDDRAGPYWVDRQQGHELLADDGWKQYRQGPAVMSDYALAHLPVHLAGAERWNDLETLLTDEAVIETRCQREMIYGLMADLAPLARTPDLLGRVSAAMLNVFCRHEKDSFWQQVRGGLYQVFGPYDRWPQPWQECLQGHTHYLAMRFLGDTLDMEDRFTDAKKVFQRMLEMADPNSPDAVATAHIRLAYVLEHLDQPKEGLDLVEKFIAEPGAPQRYGRNYRWAQHHRGICLRRLGRYREAKRTLKEICREGPEGEGLTTGPLHQLGVIDLHLGRFEEAEKKFEECRRLRGEDPWNRRRAYEYRRLGQVYALTGRFQQARDAFDRALEICTNCGDRRYLRETEEDIVAFLDVPLSLMEEAPEEVSLDQLADRLPMGGRLRYWAFRVLDQQKRGYLEVLDPDSGEPTRRIVPFDVAHRQGHWHGSVAVLIGDGNGNVVLQQRGEEDSHGKWDVSVAGHVGVGENDVAAAIRETAEELGTVVAPLQLRRLARRRQLSKEGCPDVTDDRHLAPFHYVYRTDKVNRERISLFRVRATPEQIGEINGKPPRSALDVDRQPWGEAVAKVRARPDLYASGLKQLLHPDILGEIGPCP